MSTEKAPVSGLLETRVLQREEKRKFSPGGAEGSSYFPPSLEDHKERLRDASLSTGISHVSVDDSVVNYRIPPPQEPLQTLIPLISQQLHPGIHDQPGSA